MVREGTGPDFIEALARGLEVITAFQPQRPTMSLSQVAGATGLARPTARRILLTLQELGYVRASADGFALTPKVLELGVAYVRSMGLWDVARPHMERLVDRTGESCSIGQLDGSDIVYVARVAVPKIVGLAVQIGTRFPALPTSLGKICLAALTPAEVERELAEPSRSGVDPPWKPGPEERDAELREVRARGWALTDEQLAPGIRSIAAPLRDGSGRVIAAINVNSHAAETSLERLLEGHLPLLLQTAGEISADFARLETVPQVRRVVTSRPLRNEDDPARRRASRLPQPPRLDVPQRHDLVGDGQLMKRSPLPVRPSELLVRVRRVRARRPGC